MAENKVDIEALVGYLKQQQAREPPTAQNTPALPTLGAQPGPTTIPVPNASGTIALPQPSSFGNVDLSSQQLGSLQNYSQLATPVHPTGLQNAMARAPGMAADRGQPPSSHRARSRSPNRRDTNHSYRDERRSDRRGGNGNGRPRSRVAANDNRDAQDTDSDIIEIDSNAVGLIIGRGGENMKRIEEQSGARVQFMDRPDPNNPRPRRQCKVTGTKSQRADAIADIFYTQAQHPKKASDAPSANQYQPANQSPPVNYYPPASHYASHSPTPHISSRSGSIVQREIQSDKSELLVPDKTVGLIIGRKGETIRDIQEKSRCHVNITSEKDSINGQRPVNLIGDVVSRRRAAELINEIVNSDVRTGASSPPATPREVMAPPPLLRSTSSGPNYGPSQYANLPQDQYGSQETHSMRVPSAAVGMIIGRSGEAIKNMQSASACKINVSQPQGADVERHIELLGSRSAIHAAVELIEEKVRAATGGKGGQGGQNGRPGSGPGTGANLTPYGQSNPPPPQMYSSMGPPTFPAGPPQQIPGAPPDLALNPWTPMRGYSTDYNALMMAAAAAAKSGHAPPPS